METKSQRYGINYLVIQLMTGLEAWLSDPIVCISNDYPPLGTYNAQRHMLVSVGYTKMSAKDTKTTYSAVKPIHKSNHIYF